MVKPDVKHNYYADLELPTTCSIDDIKKQYRKLALQYHPDRNAGKEEEFVPKFQAIQTAHEVLGDNTTKAKYDADRRKAGLYPNFRPGQQTQAPGNPYAATSPYPPPPRRTQPGTWQRPQPAASPGATPTGADRFTNFPRGAPTARKDPAQDRTNAFQAWQNMKTAQERQQQAQQQSHSQPQPQPQPQAQAQAQAHRFPPGSMPPPTQPSPNRPRPPPRNDTKMPSEDEIRAGMKHRKAPPPRFDAEAVDARQTAWASFQQNGGGKPSVSRSNTTRTPKKQGFDPNLPGSDERPAGGNAYVHRDRHRSEDFGRPTPAAFPPPPPGPPPQSPTSPYSPNSQRSFGDPLRPFKSRTTEEPVSQVPYAEGNRKRTPYTSFIGEKTPFKRESPDGLRRSASTRDASRMNANGANATRAQSTSPLGRHQKTKGHEQNGGQQKPFVDYSDSDASDDDRPMEDSSDEYPSKNTTPAEPPSRPGTAPQVTTPFERPKKYPTPPSRRFNGSTNPFSPPPPQSADGAQSDTDRPGMQQKTSNNIFTFPFKQDIMTPNKSRSEENIKVDFSPEGWKGSFQGSEDYFASSASATDRRKPSLPSRRQKSSLRSATAQVPSPSPGPTPEADVMSTSAPGGVKFSKEEWEKTFQDASWTWPPPPPNPPSPKKAARSASRKASKSGAKSSAPGVAPQSRAVDEDDTVEVEGADGKLEHGAPLGDEVDAMDIDSTPPAQNRDLTQESTPTQADAKDARLYSVPPSAWRQQQQAEVNGHHRKTSSRASGDANLNANLDDLSNVEPIARNANGLHGLADMSSTLPFQSQASATLPTHPLEPHKLQMPPVPKAPEAPHKLTKESWHSFAVAFGGYLQAYHAFNNTMIRHFDSREQQARVQLSAGTSWLEATGDTAGSLSGPSGPGSYLRGVRVTGPSGFGSYLQGVKEDEKVREAWNMGCERHNDAVKNFEKIRERVKKLAANGTLVDH